MDTNKKGKTILDRLDNADQKLLQNNEYAAQFLNDEGINAKEELEFAAQYMKKIQFMVTAAANKQRDEKLFEEAFSKIKETIRENAQKATDALISLLHSKTPSIQYRKLENWTDDEIREVLADIDLVTLMEELNKQK